MRYRIPALRRDAGLKRALETGLGGNGVRSVTASECTGSVLVLFDPARPLADIERRIRDIAKSSAEGRAPTALDMPDWHSLDAASVLTALGSGPEGVSAARARALLRRHGANALPKIARRSGLELLVGQFRSLPVALLAGTAMLSLLTGGAFDAAIVLAVIALNGLIGFVSESWTEETIASLESGEQPAVQVLRGGDEAAVSAEGLVPGDVILLRRDDLVPADARIIAADRLTVNEALLTGESVPVAKAANVLAAPQAPLSERRNMVFRGSVVTGGSGRAVVVATGDRTEIARVQHLLGSVSRPETPLQEQLGRLGRVLVIGSIAAAGLTLVLGLLRGRPLLIMLRSAVSLGVAAVPEGLPTMVTTTLAFGTRRLAQQRLLVRRLEAIEALGSIRLVCFDKTGTLTLNQMTVTRLQWDGRSATFDDGTYRDGSGGEVACGGDPDLARLIEVCVLCNDAVPAGDGALSEVFDGSPTETALLAAADRLGIAVAATRQRRPRLAVLARAADRRYMVTIHALPDGGRLVAVKGDPLALLPLCHWRSEAGANRALDDARRRVIETDNLAMAKAGLRVLGIAYRLATADEDLTAPGRDLVWLGLVGMADPIRRGAADLVRSLQRAGIGTVMLTGDQRETAVAIAAEAGLAPRDSAEVVEPNGVDTAPLAAGSHRIFARLTPAQKLRIVADLQRSGVRVAMIGDGVNDTPALRAADVGITLAASATAAARDVADIVLLGDDLAPLRLAFESGRSVRLNIRRAIRFLIATNLSEIMLTLFATATGLVRPLSPGQLLWINLVTDVLPAMGLALEPPDPAVLATPPPDASEPVLSRADMPALAGDAAAIAGSALVAEIIATARAGRDGGAGVGFATLVTGQLLYALACRPPSSRPPSATAVSMLSASFALQGAGLFLPGLRNIAGRSLGAADLALAGVAGAVPLLLRKVVAGPRLSPQALAPKRPAG